MGATRDTKDRQLMEPNSYTPNGKGTWQRPQSDGSSRSKRGRRGEIVTERMLLAFWVPGGICMSSSVPPFKVHDPTGKCGSLIQK